MQTTKTIGATTRDALRVYAKAAWKRKPYVIVILLFVTVATVADTILPWFLKRLFDLLEGNAITTTNIMLFVPVLLGMAGVRLVGWLGWRVTTVTTNRFQPMVKADLEERSFAYMLGHSFQFFANHFGGSLVRKISRFSRGFERIADEIEFQILPVSIVILGATIGLYIQYPLLAILFVAWTLVFLAFNFWASQWAVKADIERAAVDSETGAVLADAITNALTIKLFSARAVEEKMLRSTLQRLRRAYTKSWDRHELILPCSRCS